MQRLNVCRQFHDLRTIAQLMAARKSVNLSEIPLFGNMDRFAGSP